MASRVEGPGHNSKRIAMRPVWVVIYHRALVTSFGRVPQTGRLNVVYIMDDLDGSYLFSIEGNPGS